VKLTKTKLKQIIKEELTHVLQTEGFFSSVGKAFGLGKEKVDINSILKSVSDEGNKLISVWTNPHFLQNYDKAYSTSVSSDPGRREKSLSKPIPTALTKHAEPFLKAYREFMDILGTHIKTLGDAKIDEAFFTSAVAGKALGQKGKKGNIFHLGDEERAQLDRQRQYTAKKKAATLTPEQEAHNSLSSIGGILGNAAKNIADPRSLDKVPSVMIQKTVEKFTEFLNKLTAEDIGEER